jgi:prepilin-type N-terminal cleavage/methylation domain-containing protein
MSAAPPIVDRPGRSGRSEVSGAPSRVQGASRPRARLRAARSRGFTLIELSIVLVIIAVMAALAFATLGAIRQKNAVSLAPKQFMAVLATARQEAMLNARDVVFVLIGNQGAADAAACNSTILPSTSPKCVHYWIIEDLPDPPANGRFDAADELVNFNPATPLGPTGTLLASGDRVLSGGYLPPSIFLGKAPGYAPPPAPGAGAVYRELWTSGLFAARPDCSFCVTVSGVPRMLVRFDARGQMDIVSAGNPRAGIVFFAAAKGPTDIVPDTRTVALFEPFGLTTDRLGSRIR